MTQPLMFAVALVALGMEADPAFHIAPYLQRPEGDSVTVMWETTQPVVGEVQFGPTPELDQGVLESEPKTVHEVELNGLLPRTRYYYQVRCGELASELLSFRTPPEPGADRWRLVVYGDSRSFPDRHRRVAELAARFDPDLVLHTGDQVTRGTQRPQWKQQFFDPAAKLFSRVPVLTSLGNHEEGAGNYYEYLALPDVEQYYSIDFGNARIVVLDSNTWGSSARQSEQFAWLMGEIAPERARRWNLVAFHHPLFSAHNKRSINRARWDWWPLFQEFGVDLVLTGHDHFYFRSWPIGWLTESPSRGTTHITTAGGGAPLYQLRERSYTATQRAVHHFTVLDFERDQIRGQVIDVDGSVIDRFQITKDPTPSAEFCAYEVYELERTVRRAIESRLPMPIDEDVTRVNVEDNIQIAHPFRVPVVARLTWQDGTADLNAESWLVHFAPGDPVVLPVKHTVSSTPLRFHAVRGPAGEPSQATRLPRMKLEFADDRFRNTGFVFSPLKLWRKRTIRSYPVSGTANREKTTQIAKDDAATRYRLVRADGSGPASLDSYVSLTHTEDKLIVVTTVHDSQAGSAEEIATTPRHDTDALLKSQNIRLLLATQKHQYSFVVTRNGRREEGRDDDWLFDTPAWSAKTQWRGDAWTVEITVPRKLIDDDREPKINLVHSNPLAGIEDCLSPTFDVGTDPDLNPDFRFGDRTVSRFARLLIE